ncbi:apolipoprotein N-acyltransferase [Chitinivibrio alkaliphilus]|uniref:Apolipoprotein N-acyltransferase n=1 Tax=Chitinivibrio alkaliphilus ACht1 TaxID=1313304 RepID=U7DAI9_9BACT|nr:apolipoprotein N-acyltransferase [Chitinivibrio alkaliphilus]ERP31410.1 apolipoprotein N-acyltransferase [Chitinivibrio alkaliphilus ACht1]
MGVMQRGAWMFWIVLCGGIYGFFSPPLNSEYTVLFYPLPFISLAGVLGLFHTVWSYGGKKGACASWLWGVSSVATGTYWILAVDVVDIPGIMFLGLVLMSLFLGLWSLLFWVVGRFFVRHIPGLFWLFIPVVWVVLDYGRTMGQLSFPWHFPAHALVHFHAFAQLSSLTGVWGMTFVALLPLAILYQFFRTRQRRLLWYFFAVLCGSIGIIVWGYGRVESTTTGDRTLYVGIIQPDIDKVHWDGWVSLERSLRVMDSLVSAAYRDGAEMIVLPESALFTYLSSDTRVQHRVNQWRQRYGIPVIAGALDRRTGEEGYAYYNGAFYFPPETSHFYTYYKHKLVPYGESAPLAWLFPLINPRDLGGGDFTPGTEQVIWEIDTLHFLPYICYEAIYPSFIGRKTDRAHILVNITNDRWFGLGVGPYQHKNIARLRSIETGLPLIRAANNGISFVTDATGAIQQATSLGTREYLVAPLAVETRSGLYVRWGDWFIPAVVLLLFVVSVAEVKRKGRQENSD